MVDVFLRVLLYFVCWCSIQDDILRKLCHVIIIIVSVSREMSSLDQCPVTRVSSCGCGSMRRRTASTTCTWTWERRSGETDSSVIERSTSLLLTYGTIYHAISEHVIHYTSSEDSLKLIYSKELFTHEQ